MRRAATCSSVRRTARSAAWLGFLAASAALPVLWPAPSAAQDASRIGAAIRATCGEIDAETEAVVAGTVTDSVSGVPLRQADVHMEWKDAGGLESADAKTDGRGFFAFCRVPAGVEVTLVAYQRKTSGPVTLMVEPGMLHVQRLTVALSDPTRPGILVGRVVDSESRRPVVGATVELRQEKLRTATNAEGYFTFGNQPWGAYTLRLSNLGYAGVEVPVRVQGDLTQIVEIALSPDALELEGLTVSVQPRNMRRDMDGLVHRMDLGLGDFVTRDVLERRPMARVSDLLREVPGMQVDHRRFYTTLEVRGRSCAPNVFLDGVRYQWDPTLGVDLVSAGDLEAIEVYKGMEVPGEFLLPGQARACAAVVMWTRGVGH